LEEIPAAIKGFWSLWQIGMVTHERRRQRVLPVFVHDDGRTLQPTARFVWDELNEKSWRLSGTLPSSDVQNVFSKCEEAARDQGREVYLQLRQRHLNQLQLEQEKTEYSFRTRRQLVSGIGLPEVRAHRLRQIVVEEEAWKRDHEMQKQALPELVPIMLLRIN
jgi:hypothetical protein